VSNVFKFIRNDRVFFQFPYFIEQIDQDIIDGLTWAHACSPFCQANSSCTASLTVSIFSAFHAFAPQKRSPFPIFPFTALIRPSVIQYGISAGLHFARHLWHGLWGIWIPFATCSMSGFKIARPGMPTGLFTIIMSSFEALIY